MVEKGYVIPYSREDDGINVVVSKKACIDQEEGGEKDPEQNNNQPWKVEKETIPTIGQSHSL